MAITTLEAVVQKNGATGTNVVNYLDGVTGQVEDTTHSDTFFAADAFSYKIVTAGSSGSQTLNHIGIKLTTSAVGATVVKDIIGRGVIPFAR